MIKIVPLRKYAVKFQSGGKCSYVNAVATFIMCSFWFKVFNGH